MAIDLAALQESVELTPTGLSLPPGLPFPQWEAIGRTLIHVEQSVQWAIGDWLNYGERAYGEKYAQAVEATGYSYQSLADAAWVAAKIQSSDRSENLGWTHHRILAAIPDDSDRREIIRAAGEGGATVAELRRAVNIYKREKAIAALPPERHTCSETDLHTLIERGDRFATVYADPAWQYENQATRASTDNHYGTMSVDEICALPVASLITENAHLHLWTTNAFIFEARRVMEAWGFEYKSMFIWAKSQMGIGNYWRVSHEICLLGVRGSLPFHDHAQMSWREWPRTRHSAKPHEMYDIIEKVSPGPYLELFARQQRDGWTSWGNEIERDLFFKEAV